MGTIINNVQRPLPRQSEIVGEIRRRIISGELAPGTQLPSLNVMSEQFEASPVTVGRALKYLRQKGFVYSEERRGTFVSDNPSCLCNIGLVLPFHPFKSNFIEAIRQEAKSITGAVPHGGPRRRFVFFNEILGPIEDVRRHHQELVAAVEAETLAGVIFARTHRLLIDTVLKANPRLPSVMFHEAVVAGSTNVRFHCNFIEKALDAVAASGRRRVAYITTMEERGKTQLVLDTARERGLVIHPWEVHGVRAESPDWAHNLAQIIVHESRRDRPQALVVDDDNLVPFATAGIAELGVRVPGDLMVVAHTNFPYPTYSAVPAVRLGVDIRQLMNTVIDLLERKQRGEDVPDEIFLPSKTEAEFTANA